MLLPDFMGILSLPPILYWKKHGHKPEVLQSGACVSKVVSEVLISMVITCTSPAPTGMTKMPPTFNCFFKSSGIYGAAAVTMILSNGANIGSPL